MRKSPPTQKELRKAARERFLRARAAEKAYQRELGSIGSRVQSIVSKFAPRGKVDNLAGLTATLNRYAEILRPWAIAVTNKMHADVERRDASAWFELAKEMGGLLRKEIFTTPRGKLMREALHYQVGLITSLPREAAERVHKLTIEAQINGTRAAEIAKEIMKSGHVTKGRADLIARTETSRTAALLLEQRAESIGSTHYRWHTSEDEAVRPEHRRLNGKIFRWDSPPLAGKNMHYNPGSGPRCRCWSEPILPDEAVMVVKNSVRRAA